MVRTPYLPALSLEVIFVISPKPVVRGFFFVPLTNDYCQKPLNLLSTRTGRRELLELLQGFVFLKYLDRSNMPSKVV